MHLSGLLYRIHSAYLCIRQTVRMMHDTLLCEWMAKQSGSYRGDEVGKRIADGWPWRQHEWLLADGVEHF